MAVVNQGQHRRNRDYINCTFGSVISMISCIQWTSEDVININVLLQVLYEHKRDLVGQKQLDRFLMSSLGKKKYLRVITEIFAISGFHEHTIRYLT